MSIVLISDCPGFRRHVSGSPRCDAVTLWAVDSGVTGRVSQGDEQEVLRSSNASSSAVRRNGKQYLARNAGALGHPGISE
jgi:hypothetical protein